MSACPSRSRSMEMNKTKFPHMWGLCLMGKIGNKMQIRYSSRQGQGYEGNKTISVEEKSEQNTCCVEWDHVESWRKVFKAEGILWV